MPHKRPTIRDSPLADISLSDIKRIDFAVGLLVQVSWFAVFIVVSAPLSPLTTENSCLVCLANSLGLDIL